MNLFYYISDFIIPILIVYILVTGLAAKIPVYDEFVKGAAEGIHTVWQWECCGHRDSWN